MSYAIRVSSLDHVPTFGASKVAGDRKKQCCKGFPCCYTSHKSLYLVAGLVWCVGIVVTAIKGADFYRAAEDKGAGPANLLGALLGGLISGVCMGQLVFVWIAKKNIDRIEMLERPYWHAAFSWKFYSFLISVNALTVMLSRFVFTGRLAMLFFCALDLNVSMSLFYSFYVYLFNWRTFGLKNRYVTGLGETLLYADAPQGEDEYERNFLSVGGHDPDVPESQEVRLDDSMESDPLSMRGILVSAAGNSTDAADPSSRV